MIHLINGRQLSVALALADIEEILHDLDTWWTQVEAPLTERERVLAVMRARIHDKYDHVLESKRY